MMNQAPVPLPGSDDELALMAQSSAAARRAVHAATYSRSAADKAAQFFKIAIRKAKNVFKDPPLLVMPTADIFPLYSASMASDDYLVAQAATLLQLQDGISASAQSEPCTV